MEAYILSWALSLFLSQVNLFHFLKIIINVKNYKPF